MSSEYESALKLERDRAADVTLAEYRIVTEATTLCMMYPEDQRLQVLKRLVDARVAAMQVLGTQMQKVVEASKHARVAFREEEESNDLH